MTSMYVLIGGVEYEGSDVLGVFSSHEQAVAARDHYVAELASDSELYEYGYYRVQEFELDAAPVRHSTFGDDMI